MKKFKVLRQHLGDRMYMPGETREIAENEVAHLVKGGILEPTNEKPGKAEKAEADAAPANKAEGASPANKADTDRKTRSKE